MASLFIPSKIKVGFQQRSGTFTGKLAYVIYYDSKGVLRKEGSWESWRDKKIEPLEIENTPRTGFLFNKGVQRGGYNWGSGRSSIRVYDPRDFEFEINVDNLMGILMHSDVSKRDIIEECVFAWEGKDLVLLPVNSEEYQESVKYTKKLSEKLSAKSLVKGYTYNQKRSDDVLTYVGYMEWFAWALDKELAGASGLDRYSHGYDNHTSHHSLGKKHIFYDEKTKTCAPYAVDSLSTVNTEEVAENYASIVEGFYKTRDAQEIVEAKIVPCANFIDGNYFSASKMVNGACISVSNWIYGGSGYFKDLDDRSTSSEFIFKNRKAIRKYKEKANSTSWMYTRKAGPIEQELIAISTSMGFDVDKISKDDLNKVLAAAGFGKLVYVLKNGEVCKSN